MLTVPPQPADDLQIGSNAHWRSHAQFSADFKHTVLKQRKAQYRIFSFNTRKGLSATESSPKMALEQTIPGEVILQEVSLLKATDYYAMLAELMSNRLSLQLVSSDQVDPGKSVNAFSIMPLYLI
jgi:hypothetical protein